MSLAVPKSLPRSGADYLLAAKANQPTLRSEIERLFADARPGTLDSHLDHDKGHGRIEERLTVVRDVDWLAGVRRFPGETRLPAVACLVRVATGPNCASAAAPTPASTTAMLWAPWPFCRRD